MSEEQVFIEEIDKKRSSAGFLFFVFSKSKSMDVVVFVFSFLVVALGQPHFPKIFSLLAYLGGHAVFWTILLRIQKKNRRFLLASLWFFFVQCVQLSWFITFEYHGSYIVFAYLLICILLGLQYGLLSLLLPLKTGSFHLGRACSLAAFWSVMEWLRLFFLCGFAFNPLGLALSGNLVTLQMASLIGILGMSFWVIWINGLAFAAITEKNFRNIMQWLIGALLPICFGVFHLHTHANKLDKAPEWKVALVQPGLRMEEKNLLMPRWDSFLSPYEQWQKIFSYLPKKETFDFIVLPEAAVPFRAFDPVYSFDISWELLKSHYGEQITQYLPLSSPFISLNSDNSLSATNAFFAKVLSNYYNADVIIGLDSTDSNEKKNYNAAFHFSPVNSKENRYEKQILVPLGEYLPFSFLRKLVARYGITDFFSPGVKTKVFQGKAPISISICYEECFSHIIRKGREAGANLLINVTNDAYYPNTNLPRAHYELGKIRAIENGVPLLRSCNTGVTACIDCLGRSEELKNEEGHFEWVKGALCTKISSYHYKTLYSICGNYLIIGLSFVILLLFFMKSARKTFLSKEKKLRIS